MRVRAFAAAAAVTLALCPPAHAADPAVPDATLPGPYAVTVTEYDGGEATFLGDGRELWQTRLRGALFVPVGPGPFPVVQLLHGVSPYDCRPRPLEEYKPGVGCPPGDEVPNHRGYDYVATVLASHGYAVDTVLTPSHAQSPSGSPETDAGASERAELLLRHLDLLRAWNAGPGPAPFGDTLAGRLDLSRIGAMGHSRGGDGVSALIDRARTRTDGPRYTVSAVFTIASTDAVDSAPHGAAYGVLLPMCDGDVQSMDGAHMWDRGRFADPAEAFARAQFTIRGANHNWFNTVWAETGGDDVYNESAGPDSACYPDEPTSVRLTEAEQRRVGLTLVAAFFRRYLGGETAFDPLMTGEETLAPDGLLGTSYLAPAAARRVALTHAPGEPVTLAGFTAAWVCDPSPPSAQTAWADYNVGLVRGLAGMHDPAACPSRKTWSAARQLALRWDGPASVTVPLGGVDASAFAAVTFRSGVNFPVVGTPAPAVDVVLTDTAGRTATVTVAGGRALTEPEGSSARRLVLNGVRVPLTSFHGVRRDRLASVTLRFGGTGPGSMQLAEVALQ